MAYNCLEPLKECLASLERQRGCSFETIVVDNASTDGAIEFLSTRDIEKIFPGKNIGFGAAVNLGAQRARGKYLFILNPDTVLPLDALNSLFNFAERHPHCGLISPALTFPDGAIQLSARKLPRRRDLFWGRSSPLFKLGLTDEKQAGYIAPENCQPLKVPAVSATALLVPSDIFMAVGCFDERYFMYMEDIDLCHAVTARGHEIWLLPTVKVAHGWRKSSANRPYFTMCHHHLSVLKYFLKYEPGHLIANVLLLAALIAGFTLNSLLILFRKRG